MPTSIGGLKVNIMAIAILETLLLVTIAGSVVFYLACALCTGRFFAATDRYPDSNNAPVSIMVPVCGLDAGAWENWSSLCQQNYRDYEVLFGVTDRQDPAVPLLEKLVATFPERARLFVGLEPRGINHKDSNLSYLLEESRHEIIIFADSDIRVNQNYIQIVTAPLADARVGMVTCAYVGRDPQSLGAAIASFGRCVDFIPSLLIARFLDRGLRCAVGVTMATRKTTLAEAGGLHLNRIGSDYNLGKRMAIAGYRVELSRYILESDTGCEGLGQVFQRELRWARTIRTNRGAQYYTMVFCYGIVCCIPLLLLSGFAGWAIAATVTLLVIRTIQVAIALWSMNCPRLLRWLWTLPLRDLLSFTVWGMGAFGQQVFWRGRWLRIESDGAIGE